MPMPMPTAATGSELMLKSMSRKYIIASESGWAMSDGSITMKAPMTDT